MLQKELVDGHLVHGLFGDVGHPGKEALMVLFGVQLIPEVREIHLERWIADDEIKLLERLALPVIGVQHGVALDDVWDGMHQVVQDQVQTQKAG